jgi:rubredoxin
MSAFESCDESVQAAPWSRLECKICWHVYDPAEGDPVWQVDPGTPFSALPEHWSCPNCAATKDQFLVLSDR